jgi:hypothetical protein
MEAITIEIINPKVKNIIKDLAALKLINIGKPIRKNNELDAILKKLRSHDQKLSLEEITKEVETVRAERYARKAK